jgi:ABC-2 type transport system permease protein
MKDLNAITTIAARDVTKLLRDKTRLLANFIFPIIFIGVLGTSLQANFDQSLPYNFLTFVFTGVLAQTLFQSTASGVISLIEDRQNDFAQEMFIAPISRYSILMGKIVGETIVAFVQSSIVITFSLIIGVPISILALIKIIPFMILVAIMGGAFGVLVMSNLNDQKTASQIFPFLLFPQIFLAGVFNPIKILPLPLLVVSRLMPMTYAVDLIRSVYYGGFAEQSFVVINNFWVNIAVVSALLIIFLSIGTYVFVKKESNK